MPKKDKNRRPLGLERCAMFEPQWTVGNPPPLREGDFLTDTTQLTAMQFEWPDPDAVALLPLTMNPSFLLRCQDVGRLLAVL